MTEENFFDKLKDKAEAAFGDAKEKAGAAFAEVKDRVDGDENAEGASVTKVVADAAAEVKNNQAL